MPRGRHRHSPPLHKLLPPSAVAGAAVLCAAGAWFFTEPVVLRGLVAATAVAAVSGAVLMRSWDRGAGRQVAELTRGRESDQWRAEERTAELEADVEESRELRLKLEAKLRAKRVELAGLRGEHAALLRRYATAETERATALEGRRQLAIEASAVPKALTAGGSPTSAAYLSAARALDELSRNGAAQQAKQMVEAARERDLAERAAEAAAEAEEPQGKHAAGAGAAAGDQQRGGDQHSRPSSALPARRVPGASAIVPYASRHPVRRPEGGFDFFGTQTGHGHGQVPTQSGGQHKKPAADAESAAEPEEPAPAAELARAASEDLADVVGEEALAERRRTDERAVGQVIDLTEHDETEPVGAEALRDAVST
ncbi:coiled-coil domain-containing protein [Streptomyces sp. NPDC001840]